MTTSANELTRFIDSWDFTRKLTFDLLADLSQAELDWSPAASVGVFWKQFRHIGRVQENYMQALDTGTVKFSSQGTQYSGGADRLSLSQYLAGLDDVLRRKLETIDSATHIDWFGEPVSVREHLNRLSGHETLHHGQWIIYCRLLGKSFPESWSVWGL